MPNKAERTPGCATVFCDEGHDGTPHNTETVTQTAGHWRGQLPENNSFVESSVISSYGSLSEDMEVISECMNMTGTQSSWVWIHCKYKPRAITRKQPLVI